MCFDSNAVKSNIGFFNRTIIECKQIQSPPVIIIVYTFNRTIIECKHFLQTFQRVYKISFNRTIIECKQKYVLFFQKFFYPLIEL